ncbi:MAG: SpoIVB peptidase [Syntrophomonadaceae bacterium]|nr:SpoIVB peptidase [Syntrophomonadaceae bacterium]
MFKKRPLIGICLSLLFLAVCFHPQIRTILVLPATQKMVVGETSLINLELPDKLQRNLELTVSRPARNVFAPRDDAAVGISRNGSGYEIIALKPGTADISLNLWGYIPIKSIQIQSLPPRRVVTGGHSIGVFLHSQGIMVVGFAPILGDDGQKINPGREAGMEIGDLIMKADGQTVNTETDLAQLIDSKGSTTMQLNVNRGGKELLVTVTPVHCAETNRFRIGLFIRDGVVGVGTMTCWDPQSRQYAALGHIIVDADTKQGISVMKGKIVSAAIQTVKPGRPGWPGEKIGVFNDKGSLSGNISKNTPCGIYGEMEAEPVNPHYPYQMEVAYAHQVKEGPAQIMTVINGEDIEKFDIVIEKKYPARQNGRDMIIKVTDPRLISITGGIIQGMSGSPIIQDDRLAGAVTHVFLNDPQTGYGIFMDNILSEMSTQNNQEQKVSTPAPLIKLQSDSAAIKSSPHKVEI